MTDSSERHNYIFRHVDSAREETERLDYLHKAITDFFRGRLSLASLDDEPTPENILEIGSGSGAWAIQAAERFPQSKVVAIDLTPIPARRIPPNLEYKCVDITHPFPFEQERFDVVHARLVMLHVPNGEEVLRRVIKLVKPGGWLIVEDPDDYSMADGGGRLGPGMSAFLDGWMNVLRSSGADPGFGRKIEQILHSSGVFSEINVKKVVIPISGKSDNPETRSLGLHWRTNMIRVGHDLPQRWSDFGITSGVAKEYIAELEDPERDITTTMYFSYSRKRASS